MQAMSQDLNEIQDEIRKLKARNKRVELDKAWEISWTRRILIALITYILIVIFMASVGLDEAYKAAIVPAIAYLISMSALPLFKKWWIKRQ